MATYAAAGSNGSMESWYPLVGFVESRIWAQMMRQISRRAADVGITCNWRNGVVNPGTAVQYPTDDFLVGLAADPLAVCHEYMEQIFGTLEDVCEAQFLDDCKLWFFAPNEASLPYCSGLDGTAPMTFTVPTLVEDRTKWKEWMTKMRQVVNALDRLKTVWPIPNPLTLYSLVTDTTRTIANYGYIEETSISGAARPAGSWEDVGEPFPTSGAGYCLDEDNDYTFPGWDSLSPSGDSRFNRPGDSVLFLESLYHYPVYAGGGPYAVSSSSSGAPFRTWAGVGKVTYSGTAKFSDEDWDDFVATYGTIVNSISWSYVIEPSSGPDPNDTQWDAPSTGDVYNISVNESGGGTVVVVGNGDIEFEVSVELGLNGEVFKVFKDGPGSTREADCATKWVWGEDLDFSMFVGDGGFVSWGASGAMIDPGESEVTACDI